jgi:hypothetical protein
MSKLVQGAALLGLDAALVAGAAFTGGADMAVAFMATKLFSTIAVAGVAMEAGAIAAALTQNRGVGVTIRQPAANRNYVYGTQRIGGTQIYQNTTGGHRDQYNLVIVLADHECYAIENLFLDGRQVFWDPGSFGNTTRNGINFGGNSDGSDHTDEGGNHYNFGGPLVYCEARYGDQLPGDVITGLTANDPTWVAANGRSPYVGGCTYVYLKIEFDQAMFPQFPEIRFTVRGKNDIWDPRTSTTGYTNNWALCLADALMENSYGVGALQSEINTAQLIAAANVCDEQVPLADGQTESRYTCNGAWDTGTSPGDLLASMMPSAQGRLSYAGGKLGSQWYIFPAYWQGATLSFSDKDVLKAFPWNTAALRRERYNRVAGTYIAPRFPYSVAGNLYDSNGFFDGTRANTFNLEWMAEAYPYYAQDAFHGYASDRWLTADAGIERWLSLDFKCCISIATAQRCSKIALLRNRLCAGKATITMGLAAYQAIPCDVIQLTYSAYGWVNKLLEVTGVRLRVESIKDGDPPTLLVDLDVQETDPSIYDWNAATEELNIYGARAA